jgi:hypothetical protein
LLPGLLDDSRDDISRKTHSPTERGWLQTADIATRLSEATSFMRTRHRR